MRRIEKAAKSTIIIADYWKMREKEKSSNRLSFFRVDAARDRFYQRPATAENFFQHIFDLH